MVRDINGLGGYANPKSVSEQGSKTAASAIETSPSKPEATTTASGDGMLLSNEAHKVDGLVLADKILNSAALSGN